MMTNQTNTLIKQRAEVFDLIRDFFRLRKVLEVDTSLMAKNSVTDPYMSALKVLNPINEVVGYLQTSPEFAMKRLLANGSGDIFQLGKAFRADEKGKNHHPEFTLLEWYRIDFSLQALMQEVYKLIINIVGDKKLVELSYQQAFINQMAIDPLTISDAQLEKVARQTLGDLPDKLLRDNYLSLLFSEIIEPAFIQDKVTFIYHFPASQASLAKLVQQGDFQVAERFEVYSGGIELANGFHELTDPIEQLARFRQDNLIREQLGYPQVEIDYGLIKALEKGLPDCSGVALGIDRLMMLKLNKKTISSILPLAGD